MNQTEKLQAVMIKQALGGKQAVGLGTRVLNQLRGGAKAWREGAKAVRHQAGVAKGWAALRRGGDDLTGAVNKARKSVGLPTGEFDTAYATKGRLGKHLTGLQNIADDTWDNAGKLFKAYRYGAGTIGGLGAYGGLQGAGYLGGALTADRSGQRQVNYLSSMPRLGMLFNPQGTVQNMSRDMASTRPQGSALNFLPFMGGWRAGNRKVMEKGDQQLIKMLNGGQNLPFLVRLMYALNPEGTVNKMIQSEAGQ